MNLINTKEVVIKRKVYVVELTEEEYTQVLALLNSSIAFPAPSNPGVYWKFPESKPLVVSAINRKNPINPSNDFANLSDHYEAN
jgi:hypothetical protein